MSASTIRKKYNSLLKALQADPEITVIDHSRSARPPATRVDAKLAEAGLTVSEETRAYLGEVEGMSLAWIRGSFANPQAAWDAWNTSVYDDKAKIGRPAGHFRIERPLNLLHPPFRRIPDQVGLKLLDDFDPGNFYPIALDVNPGKDLCVRMGEDHGVSYTEGNPITLGGYLEMMIATAGTGRNDLLLRRGRAKDRALLDAAGWFEDFDVNSTLKLIKGDAEMLARWQEIGLRVPVG